MRARATIAVAVAALALGGCAAGFWSSGIPEHAEATLGGASSTLVVSVGEAGWDAASKKLTQALKVAWPFGLPIEGEGEWTDEARAGGSSLTAMWQGAVMFVDTAELLVTPLGLEAEIDVLIDRPFVVELEVDGLTACLVTVELTTGTLHAPLALVRTKTGTVKAAPAGPPTLDIDEATAVVDAYGCPDLAALGLTEDEPTALLLDALAEAALELVNPTLTEMVPTTLGIGLSAGLTASFGDDGVGVGELTTLVRVPPAVSGELWTYATDRLVVPYGVHIDAKRHACVPDVPLPAAASTAVPTIGGAAAVLVHEDIVARALAGLWRAGGLCMDRVTNGITLDAGSLAESWLALGPLDPQAPIALRLWPEELPSVVLEPATADGGVTAWLSTGALSVDVVATLDDTELRLATLRVSLEVQATVDVTLDGSVWLTPVDVVVASSASEEGFVAPPTKGALTDIAGPLVELLLSARPVWALPPLPGGAVEQVTLAGGFLVFAVPE